VENVWGQGECMPYVIGIEEEKRGNVLICIKRGWGKIVFTKKEKMGHPHTECD